MKRTPVPQHAAAGRTTGILALCLIWAGCGGRHLPEGALVLTQTPLARTNLAPTLLDQRYPMGSRVVLVCPPYSAKDVRVLSQGLVAAGEPVSSPAGDRVLFSGKAATAEAWQIYEADLGGGHPRQLTSMPGGAMNPSLNGSGAVVFSSPVPKADGPWTSQPAPALYVQNAGASAQRLTFGTSAAVEPTALADGRILFVSAHPDAAPGAPPALGLFTINNDGTELTAFALDHDGAPLVCRPRELPDGRIAFLASTADERAALFTAEAVRTARPFATRSPLLRFPTGRCSSVESGRDGSLLVCLDTRGSIGRSMRGASAVFRIDPAASSLGQALFEDAAWDQLEATPLRARPGIKGHISVMVPTRKTGLLLCLDARFTRSNPAQAEAKAERVRVLAATPQGQGRTLGEIVLHPDGSFMAEVPADVPLGFETLDAQGHVLQRVPPHLWVRSGENRSCLGCHEPPNHSPRNVRPLAVWDPPVVLGSGVPTLAKRAP